MWRNTAWRIYESSKSMNLQALRYVRTPSLVHTEGNKLESDSLGNGYEVYSPREFTLLCSENLFKETPAARESLWNAQFRGDFNATMYWIPLVKNLDPPLVSNVVMDSRVFKQMYL